MGDNAPVRDLGRPHGAAPATMTIRGATFAAALLCLGGTGAAAQPVPELGAKVTPKEGCLPKERCLTAWEAPPSGFSLSRGREVACIAADEDYLVIDTRVIPSLLFGDSYYLRIKSEDDRHACAEGGCWVYLGRERDASKWNMNMKEEQ